MSQWADNADTLNQWAESRRQFVDVCVCMCVRVFECAAAFQGG